MVYRKNKVEKALVNGWRPAFFHAAGKSCKGTVMLKPWGPQGKVMLSAGKQLAFLRT
jgi:hypothetical protein